MKYKDIIFTKHEEELLRAAALLMSAILWDDGKHVKVDNKKFNSFYTFDFSEYEKAFPNNKKFSNLKKANTAESIREILFFEDAHFSKTFKKSDLKEKLNFLDGWARGRFSINPGFTYLQKI